MKKLLILLLLLFYSPAWGAVAFDACATATGDGLTTLTITSVVTTGSDVALLASTAWKGSPPTTSGVTWNASPMTIVNEQAISNRSLSVWQKAIGNSPGTHDVAFSFNDAANRVVVAACSFTGVDQTTPTGSIVTSTDYNGSPVTVTVPANGLGYNVAADYDQTPTVAAQTSGQTKRFDAWVDSGSGNNTAHFGATRTTTGAFNWTNPGGEFEAQIGVAINPTAGAVAAKRRVLISP